MTWFKHIVNWFVVLLIATTIQVIVMKLVGNFEYTNWPGIYLVILACVIFYSVLFGTFGVIKTVLRKVLRSHADLNDHLVSSNSPHYLFTEINKKLKEHGVALIFECTCFCWGNDCDNDCFNCEMFFKNIEGAIFVVPVKAGEQRLEENL